MRDLFTKKPVADSVGNISDTVSNLSDDVSNIPDAVGNHFAWQEIPETS